ncbi:hypothetical protein SDC9_75476 [bioreactor metagenome]|uniref:Uncharacterized protein n=1 Tax=bioreactor metagenome TaxID=1076179 RepID=A0A644YLR5_9ZZZZ
MQHGTRQGRKAELLAVDVTLCLEDLPLCDLDRLAAIIPLQTGQGDESLRPLGFLSLLGVIRRFEVKPRPGRMGHKHIVKNSPEQFRKFNFNAEDNHEEGVEDTPGMKVCYDEAFLLQLRDGFVLQLHKIGNRENLVEYLFLNQSLSPPR